MALRRFKEQGTMGMALHETQQRPKGACCNAPADAVHLKQQHCDDERHHWPRRLARMLKALLFCRATLGDSSASDD